MKKRCDHEYQVSLDVGGEEGCLACARVRGPASGGGVGRGPILIHSYMYTMRRGGIMRASDRGSSGGAAEI